jgi:flagellar motor component MotA
MNKLIKYAIFAYIFFSGIAAAAVAIDYSVTNITTLAFAYSVSLMGISTVKAIVTSNLTLAQQSNYATMLENLYTIWQTAEQKSLASLSSDQFMEYESLFVIPPFILLLVMAYKSKDNKNNDE